MRIPLLKGVLIGAGIVLSAHANQQTTTITVSAELVDSCTLSAGDMNFGSGTFSELVYNTVAYADIVVTCPEGSDWSVSLDGGQHAGAVFNTGFREMHHSSGGTTTSGVFEYGITYTDAAQGLFDEPWGNGVNLTWGYPRHGSGSKTMTAMGNIQTPTPNTPYGTYSDVVTVTLDY